MDADIELHVRKWVKKTANFNRWSQTIQGLIISTITKKSCGVFRCVECQLNAPSSALRECDVEDALHQLPKDVDDTYERTLNRLQGTTYMKEAWMLFHWLSFSEKPLNISDVIDAIAFKIEKQPDGEGHRVIYFDPRRRFPNPREDLSAIFSQFITITSEEHVAFSHSSVREYLMCDRVKGEFRVQESAAHLLMLESCLSYIPTSVEQAHSYISDNPIDFCLFRYASAFWPVHAKATFTAGVHMNHMEELFCKLFANQGRAYVQSLKVTSYREWLYNHESDDKDYDEEDDEDDGEDEDDEDEDDEDDEDNDYRYPLHHGHDFASPAWLMSFENLSHGLEILFESIGNNMMDLGVDKMFRGHTALHFASLSGVYDVSTILLRNGTDSKIRNEPHGATPLHLAVQSGSKEIVQLLLDAGASPLDIDHDGHQDAHIEPIQ